METGTLSSLLWFIIIGGLFYFMMRKGGCCGHVHSEHDQHKGHTHGGSNAGNMKDPEKYTRKQRSRREASR